MKKLSKTEKVLRHLKSGKRINPIMALKKYRLMSLSQRIGDLKCAGHKIYTRTVWTKDSHYSEYWM
jgi:hypothetical protein